MTFFSFPCTSFIDLSRGKKKDEIKLTLATSTPNKPYKKVFQFDNNDPISPQFNTISTLQYEQNYMKIYDYVWICMNMYEYKYLMILFLYEGQDEECNYIFRAIA